MRAPAGLTVESLMLPAGVRALFSVYRGGVLLAQDLELVSVSLESSAFREVRDRLVVEADWTLRPESEWSPLSCSGQVGHLVVEVSPEGGSPYRVDCGWFVLDEGAYRAGKVRVVCFGLLKRLADAPAAWASSPAPGATLRAELARLAGSALPVVLDAADGPLRSGLAWGRDRVDALSKLVGGFGYDMRVQSDGKLHVFAADSKRVAARYSYRDLIVEEDDSWDHHAPNVFTAVGKDESGRDNVRRWQYEAVADGDMAPSLYGVVREIVEVPAASSHQQVVAAGQRKLAESLNRRRMWSFSMVPDYRLELGDVVAVDRDGGEPVVGRVVGLQWTVGGGELARLDLEEVAW